MSGYSLYLLDELSQEPNGINDRAQVPISQSEKSTKQLLAPVFGNVLFAPICRLMHGMDVMSNFVIEHGAKSVVAQDWHSPKPRFF